MYRIGDAARMLGVSSATLRLWERQGLIQPSRSSGGGRRFSEDDLALLRQMQHLRKTEHLSPRAGARLLRLQNDEPAPSPRPGSNGTTPAPALGDRLRAERNRAGLTLRAVAEQVGISVSFLSAVERSVAGVSLSRLHALVKLYGTTVQDLVADGHATGRLIRKDERPRVPTSNHGIQIEQLAVGRLAMEPHHYVIEPGASSDGAYDHAGEELVFVLRGTLDVWIDEREHYVVGPGDSLYFPSTLPHRWCNSGSEVVELLWINTPPTF
jgi:DNA-binding transcriptional MerR regulator